MFFNVIDFFLNYLFTFCFIKFIQFHKCAKKDFLNYTFKEDKKYS